MSYSGLLPKAKVFAQGLGMEIRGKLTDQFGKHLGYDVVAPNGRRGYLLALKENFDKGKGLSKSIDYHLVTRAEEAGRLIILYIWYKESGTESLYQASPGDIINAATGSDELDVPEDETVCPECNGPMEPDHKHHPLPADSRLEVHHHRVKYRLVPFHQIYLENLNRSAARPIEEHEEYLLNKLREHVKVRYTGDQPGERQLFGFCPDYALYSHEGVGCRLLELGPKSKKEKQERRKKAEEMGCSVKFLDYNRKEVRQKTDEIVEEVVGWVNQSDLRRYGVADD